MNMFLRCVPAAIFSLLCTGVSAQTLTIGARLEPPMDPHHIWSAAHGTVYGQLYGGLTILNNDAQAVPMLASSWEQPDPNTWVFKLREDVVLHNGEKLTAADVKASYIRARDYPNTPAGYSMLRAITDIETPDDLTVVLKTSAPVPVLPHQLTQVPVVAGSALEGVSQEAFQTGKAAIGAGPYKFSRYVSGDRLELERNDQYFGPAPKWEKVIYRFISDDSARTAALLAGQVDLIDNVSPADYNRLASEKGVRVFQGPSERPAFLWFDATREKSPFVDVTPNPLTKRDVRKAIGLAIDRNLIRDRVMDGLAVPVGQLAPAGFGGHIEGIAVPAPDIAQAKQLLADAGYPDGFKLTMHCPNNRYVNDARICQGVAQLIARIGINTEVVTLPWSAFAPQATDFNGQGFSFGLGAWGFGGSGEADILPYALHTRDAAKGLGGWNLGRYSNPQVDALIPAAMSEPDRQRRFALQAEVLKLVNDDYGVIPLHLQVIVAAGREGIDYTTHAMGYVFADSVVRKN